MEPLVIHIFSREDVLIALFCGRGELPPGLGTELRFVRPKQPIAFLAREAEPLYFSARFAAESVKMGYMTSAPCTEPSYAGRSRALESLRHGPYESDMPAQP